MLIDIFMSQVSKSEECWTWTGRQSFDGYGVFHYRDPESKKSSTRGAHRWLWCHLNGEPPEGWTLDHMCENRLCVRPEHLEAKPHRDNLLRSRTAVAAVNARKTHCIRQHEFSIENTYITPDGRRQCRTCRGLPQKVGQ